VINKQALHALVESHEPFETRKLSDTQLAKPFRITDKELSRASEDGIAIVARPQQGGTKGIFAVDVSDPEEPRVRGVNWYEVSKDGDVAKAVTMLNRDLDKFFGLGGRMSDKGRMRPGKKDAERTQESLDEGPIPDEEPASAPYPGERLLVSLPNHKKVLAVQAREGARVLQFANKEEAVAFVAPLNSGRDKQNLGLKWKAVNFKEGAPWYAMPVQTEAAPSLADKGQKVLSAQEALDLYTRMITAPANSEGVNQADLNRLAKLSGNPAELDEADDGVGRTIVDQMGGGGILKAMLGATLVLIPNGIKIKWPNKERSKGNLVQITLEPSDTYKMVFYNASGSSQKVVKEYDDVYFDQLVDIFEKQTSWYLRMSKPRSA